MEHSLKILVMDVMTLPDCSMVMVAVAARTVIITSIMLNLNTDSVDGSRCNAMRGIIESIRSSMKVSVSTRYTLIKGRTMEDLAAKRWLTM